MVVKFIATPNTMQTRPLLETKNMRRVQDYLDEEAKARTKIKSFKIRIGTTL
jgi:hypothetical protein